MVTHNIMEAVSMANKVIVLSRRPCVVKKVLDIELIDGSSPLQNRKCINFDKYYDDIWKEFDYNDGGL